MLNIPTTNKATQIGIRIDQATRERLERLARKESRKLSDVARLLILEGLKRRKVA